MASDTETYNALGQQVGETQSIAGLTPSVTLNDQYDADGDRTQLAATIGGTSDFVNNYQYQGVSGQMSQVTQSGVTGGDAVAPKAVTFDYNNAGQFYTISRYADLAQTELVATSTYGYDGDGNLTSLAYAKSGNASTLPSYSWTYDAAGNVTSATNNFDGTVNYTNDSTGQLLSASGGPSPETYSYDSNGNRETANSSSYVTGPDNELLCDGTYTYGYDAEGNCISRTCIADGSRTLYTWDNRNRLMSVVSKDSSGNVTQTVTYIYDAFNRWIGETITAGTTTTQARYIYDGTQIVLEFDGTGTGALTAINLGHRYLWGPAVDQLLADEQLPAASGSIDAIPLQFGADVGLSASGETVWTLTDSQNTVRDLATYNAATNTTTVVNHRVFSAYGQLVSQTNPSTNTPAAVDCLFGYTGQAYDPSTGLQNNLDQWYDPIVGGWLSQDPIGFAGGDANLYGYVWNAPTAVVTVWQGQGDAWLYNAYLQWDQSLNNPLAYSHWGLQLELRDKNNGTSEESIQQMIQAAVERERSKPDFLKDLRSNGLDALGHAVDFYKNQNNPFPWPDNRGYGDVPEGPYSGPGCADPFHQGHQ